MVPVAIQRKYPELLMGTPRNQYIDSITVEKRVKIGMTLRQVESALGLAHGSTSSWIRTRNGRLEVEIVGTSPPWRRLPPGYHAITLVLDGRKRVIGGRGIWYDLDCDDDEPLQLAK